MYVSKSLDIVGGLFVGVLTDGGGRRGVVDVRKEVRVDEAW